MLTQADIATHLDLTQQAVSGLIARKILPSQRARGATLDAYRADYIRHLREVAAGRLGGDDTLDLVTERARVAKEMADGLSMKNAQRRGELIETAVALREFESDLHIVRTRLLSIPPGQAAHLARIKTPQAMQDALQTLIVEALDELSDPAKYAKLAARIRPQRDHAPLGAEMDEVAHD